MNNNLVIKKKLYDELQKVEALLDEELQTGSTDFNNLIRPLSQSGGKRLRANLCLLIARAGLEVKNESLSAEEKAIALQDRVYVASAIEMIHLATLIHDDVMDQADVRRGARTIHCDKGNKVAILSGDYLFSKAFSLVAKVKSVDCLPIFAKTISALVEGEFLQMEDAYNLNQSKDRYLLKTQKKTADFIEACMELGGLLGQWSDEQIALLKQYGHALGMGFQISDDVLDYRESSQTTGKPVANDVCEGILTYPLLSVVKPDTKDILQAYIDQIAKGASPLPLVDYVRRGGGIEATLLLLETYHQAALKALTGIADFTGKGLLREVVDRLADRKV